MSEVMEETTTGYKETPIGLIPKDWNMEELGKVAKIKMGQSPPSNSYNDEGHGLPLIQGNADIKNRLTKPRIWTTSPTNECHPNEIIMTVRAPVGAIAKSNINGCIGRGVCSISSSNELGFEFLYQYLISQENNWLALEQGSTFTAVNGSDIKSIKIPLPPLPEQKKIAEILTTVDDKIEVIDERIRQTQELKKGLMQRLLTKGIGHTKFKDSPLGEIPESWEVVGLSNVCEKINVGFVGTCEKYYCEKEDGVLMIRTGNLQKTLIKLDDVKYISREFHNKNKKSQLRDGDLMIARHGSNGQAVLYKSSIGEANCLNIVMVRPNQSITNKFLFYLFNSLIVRHQIQKKTAGSTQVVINTGEIITLLILLPSLVEQKQIADILTSVDDKIEVLQEKKSTYQELKKGLMQKLLTGKIRVKVS